MYFAVIPNRCVVQLRDGPVKEQRLRLLEGHLHTNVHSANTCGSASTPCAVDVKRTANAASSTPSIPNAKGNSLFCIKPGTTVQWKSTGKDIGFVVDFGPTSPFEPGRAIIGGTDRTVSVVAKKPGCYKYSAGACKSGAVYGMCGQTNAQLIITAN
jgi:plastocyanin